MSGLIECQQNLLALANDKGYLTFDDILEAADTSLLSLSDIDRLSDNLQSLGVLLYETAPEQDDDTESATTPTTSTEDANTPSEDEEPSGGFPLPVFIAIGACILCAVSLTALKKRRVSVAAENKENTEGGTEE